MKIDITWPSNLSAKEAIELQLQLAKKVITKDELPAKIKTIAGLDVSFTKDGYAIGACAVLDFDTLEPVERETAKVKVRFPYIPGLLAFREGEALLTVLKKIQIQPDILMVDGQGIAHQRRCGIASHLAILLDIASIGVAKSILIGRLKEEPVLIGQWVPLVDNDEIIGAGILTDPKLKPIIASIGHKISLETAVKIVLKTTKNSRLPEPIKLAHQLATAARF
ncbi:MAG: deoxyribonuclease V [Euryarchaeota archaeon]|nr:deoxyribonuclease V [Euryarchaeota archaeon]